MADSTPVSGELSRATPEVQKYRPRACQSCARSKMRCVWPSEPGATPCQRSVVFVSFWVTLFPSSLLSRCKKLGYHEGVPGVIHFPLLHRPCLCPGHAIVVIIRESPPKHPVSICGVFPNSRAHTPFFFILLSPSAGISFANGNHRQPNRFTDLFIYRCAKIKAPCTLPEINPRRRRGPSTYVFLFQILFL